MGDPEFDFSRSLDLFFICIYGLLFSISNVYTISSIPFSTEFEIIANSEFEMHSFTPFQLAVPDRFLQYTAAVSDAFLIVLHHLMSDALLIILTRGRCILHSISAVKLQDAFFNYAAAVRVRCIPSLYSSTQCSIHYINPIFLESPKKTD